MGRRPPPGWGRKPPKRDLHWWWHGGRLRGGSNERIQVEEEGDEAERRSNRTSREPQRGGGRGLKIFGAVLRPVREGGSHCPLLDGLRARLLLRLFEGGVRGGGTLEVRGLRHCRHRVEEDCGERGLTVNTLKRAELKGRNDPSICLHF